MNTLEKIGNLAERLADKIWNIADDREGMLSEINRLRDSLMRRDKEAVEAAHDMRAELEEARVDLLRSKQERARLEAKLQGMNDRLIFWASLANSASLPDPQNSQNSQNTQILEAEKTFGGAARS